MNKEHVFLVSVRQSDPSGAAVGSVVSHVVCARDEVSVRELVAERLSAFVIVSVVSLVALELGVKKVKQVLAGVDKSWGILVDPRI